jgi:glyoxylase-like metal-dependent hydrolase (beta-lactamase superfamily II)
MISIKSFMCNPLQENCYVVSDETCECVIIDCGAMWEDERGALRGYIGGGGLRPVHLLATHGHLDHNFGNRFVYGEYGLKVEVGELDAEMVEHLDEQARTLFGMELDKELAPVSVGRRLQDGDVVRFGSHELRVLSTPGHTHGSVLFYCESEHVVFTGDTLFRMSIGRTDFAEGSWAEMEHSLRQVVARLPEETAVLSGHGPRSTIADELKYNPYLR